MRRLFVSGTPADQPGTPAEERSRAADDMQHTRQGRQDSLLSLPSRADLDQCALTRAARVVRDDDLFR